MPLASSLKEMGGPLMVLCRSTTCSDLQLVLTYNKPTPCSAETSPLPGSLPWPPGLPSITTLITICDFDCLCSSLLIQKPVRSLETRTGLSPWSPQGSAENKCSEINEQMNERTMNQDK